MTHKFSHLRLQTLIGCLIALSPACAVAQIIGPATLNAGGGVASVGANTYEYSIGELAVVSTFSGPNLVVTHGVLQPQDAAVSIKPQAGIQNTIQVYPNPSRDILNLEMNPQNATAGRLLLTDALGRTLVNQSFKVMAGEHFHTTLDLSSFAAATYLISIVAEGEGGTVTYKISKMQ